MNVAISPLGPFKKRISISRGALQLGYNKEMIRLDTHGVLRRWFHNLWCIDTSAAVGLRHISHNIPFFHSLKRRSYFHRSLCPSVLPSLHQSRRIWLWIRNVVL